MISIDATHANIRRAGQEHLLNLTPDLSPDQQARLDAQLQGIDWTQADAWRDVAVQPAAPAALPDDLEPAPCLPLIPETDNGQGRYRRAAETGWRLLRDGKVAAMTVAGGQGSRLGYDGPKGLVKVAPISGRTLFQLFADRILRLGERVEHRIPWYIMTSPDNDGPTRDYFRQNNYLGLDKDQLFFFVQGELPVFDLSGKVLRSAADHIATAPDGHGGSLRALHQSGALADMAERGVEEISYFQVDNPLVSVVDPLFLGLHKDQDSDMSARALPRRSADEKVGLFCRTAGKTVIIEYSDFPAELAAACDESGGLVYRWGSPAIHIIRRAFVQALNEGGFQLPLHRAVKKMPHIDVDGRPVEAASADAVKLESFVFDALPLAKTVLLLEARREDEFAPVKNAEGNDSVEVARRMIQEYWGGWLDRRGVTVARTKDGALDCVIEISERRFLDEEDFQEADIANLKIEPGQELLVT